MSIIKKVISTVLILGLTVGLLAGCGTNSNDDDTVMTVNGDAVSYDLFKYWMMYTAEYYSYYYSPLDWNEEVPGEINPDETVTISESVMEVAENMCVRYLVMEQYATELGIEITDEEMQEYEDSIRESFDTEEELEAELATSSLTMDVLLYRNKISDMYTKSFEKQYGENGKLLSDELAAEYVESNGYMQAKHILFSTTDDEGNEMDDAGKQAQREKAEEVLALLNAYEGDNITAYFNELMQEYSEDTGLSSYPDGYLYTSGTMVTEFEDTAAELEENTYSEIVETAYGYHIIMRVSIDYDAVSSGSADGYTLRQLAAQAEFEGEVDDRIESAEIKHTDLYDTIVPQEIYEAAQEEQESDDADASASEAEATDSGTEATDSNEADGAEDDGADDSNAEAS